MNVCENFKDTRIRIKEGFCTFGSTKISTPLNIRFDEYVLCTGVLYVICKLIRKLNVYET